MTKVAKAEVPPPTPFERFEKAAKAIFKVPKREVEKAGLRRKKEKKAREADKREA